MKRTVLISTVLAFAGLFAPLPTWSEEAVCTRAEVRYNDIRSELLGFAWEGEPAPLSKGIMFETLVGTSEQSRNIIARVPTESCSEWVDKVSAGSNPFELRFYDKGNKLLGIGKGKASVVEASCEGSAPKIVVRVGRDFNIGMPPS